MSASAAATIRDRVQQIETMPAIPAVFLPLMKLLSGSGEDVKLDEVVRLVSYDSNIAGQCLRVAASPLVRSGQAARIHQGRSAHLGFAPGRDHASDLLPGTGFPAAKWVLDPAVFWRHSLGCAMVCRKFSEKLATADAEKAYMAGLLHDLGFMVNCLVFPRNLPRPWNALASRRFRWARRNKPPWDSRTAKPGRRWLKNGNWRTMSSM